MSEVANMVEFYRARLDEEAALVRAAKEGPWHADGGSVYGKHPTDEVVDYCGGNAPHIVRQDPARTLKRIEAERQVISRYENQATLLADHMGGILTKYLVQELLEVVRELVVPYDDHPDYREEWRP